MRLPAFKVEQWMTDYEGQAIYNLTDTCVKALSFKELKFDQKELVLDYGAITGDQKTKELILSMYQKGTVNQITTAHGCLEANELVLLTLLEQGDHVITFTPGYQQFVDVPLSIGCQVTTIECFEKDGWLPNLNEVKESIQDNTKMIILNNPNNPTGALLNKEMLHQLIHMCKEKKILIFCDEVYRSDVSLPSISDLYEYGIATSSLSKSFGLAGLRYGWIKSNKEIIDCINNRRDYSMISTGPLSDALAQCALNQKEKWLQRGKQFIQKNKEIVSSWVEKDSRFHVVLPETGTVCFLGYTMDIDSQSLALELLKEGIFFVPGSCFNAEGYLRLGLGQDSSMISTGLEKLSQWADQRIG